MADLPETARSYCLNRGARPGSVFFMTHRFTPRTQRDQVLSLQTLLVDLDSILWEVSEPAVALAKLGWWQNELQSSARQHSQHPAIQAAHRSGLFRLADETDLQRLIVTTGRLAQGEPMAEFSDLINQCRAVGSSEVQLLAAVDGTRIPRDGADALGAAMVLVRFAERMGSVLPGECWWVPLNDQARFGLAYTDPRQAGGEAARATYGRFLGEEIVGQLDLAHTQMQGSGGAFGPALAVLTAVLKRRGSYLLKRPLRQRTRPSAGEVWTAWRAATGR